MKKIPPYLKNGDKIGIVAPAGFMALDKMQSCIDTLETWGYDIKLGNTTHSLSNNYFSGSDEERLEDLQQMLDDKEIKAILCARGGYGTGRIIDQLNFKKFLKKPKWIIGYSDITVLQMHIFSKFKIQSLHAPMAAAFNEGEFSNQYIISLKNAMEGLPAEYECAGHELNKVGSAKAEVIGGNLSLLIHLIGTASDFSTKNKILFIEDIGEHIYSIDKMIVHLKRSGKLKKLSGLIVGAFSDIKDTDRPFGTTAYETIYEHVKEYNFPVAFGFPVSHEKENYALKIGGRYKLIVDKNFTTLSE